jgi:polar amino acid transport system permease protein
VNYVWDFAPVFRDAGLLLQGLINTLKLTGLSLVGGLVIGFGLALARLLGPRVLAWPAIAVIEFFRNTPPLVHFFWIFYALPIVTGIALEPLIAATIALSIQSGAFFAEVYRAGIQSIERGQWEAAKALGMRAPAMFRRIVLPQALRRMIAPLTERGFEVAKTTALAATLAYGDLLYQAMVITSKTYRPLELYTAVAVIFFLLLFGASLIMRALEHRVTRDLC